MHIGSTQPTPLIIRTNADAILWTMQIPEFNINSMEVVAHVHEIIATIKELVKLDPLLRSSS